MAQGMASFVTDSGFDDDDGWRWTNAEHNITSKGVKGFEFFLPGVGGLGDIDGCLSPHAEDDITTNGVKGFEFFIPGAGLGDHLRDSPPLFIGTEEARDAYDAFKFDMSKCMHSFRTDDSFDDSHQAPIIDDDEEETELTPRAKGGDPIMLESPAKLPEGYGMPLTLGMMYPYMPCMQMTAGMWQPPCMQMPADTWHSKDLEMYAQQCELAAAQLEQMHRWSREVQGGITDHADALLQQPRRTEVHVAKLTTIMLKNIPNDYKRDTLLLLLDESGFGGKVDFVYIPHDFCRKAGLGYAFVNFVSHEMAALAREKFDGFSTWTVGSNKVCETVWGNPLQGLDQHIQRYRNSPLMHRDVPDEFRPAVYDNGIRTVFPPPTKRIRPPRVKKGGKLESQSSDSS